VFVLPNVDAHDLDAVVVQPSGQPLRDDARKVLRGRVHVIERGQLVQEDVLVGLDERAKRSAEVRKVDDEPACIELARLDHGADLPIVAVETLPFAFRKPELMRRGDDGVTCDFPHLGTLLASLKPSP